MFQMRKEREAITNLGPKARNLWLLGERVQVPESWDPWVISLADSGGGYACAQCMCVCVHVYVPGLWESPLPNQPSDSSEAWLMWHANVAITACKVCFLLRRSKSSILSWSKESCPIQAKVSAWGRSCLMMMILKKKRTPYWVNESRHWSSEAVNITERETARHNLLMEAHNITWRVLPEAQTWIWFSISIQLQIYRIYRGQGNGNPLQYSCLENPVDRGAWWAAVHAVHRVGHDWSDLACMHRGQRSMLNNTMGM